MNMCTLAVTEEEYRKIIRTLEHGYKSECIDKDGRTYHIKHRPNYRVAMALKLEYATGLRISDIVKLRQKDIVKDGDKYRLDIVEQKTGKKRIFKINQRIYDAINEYCAERGIASDQCIVGGTTFSVQKQIKYVREYLGMERISSHSFRKGFAQKFYRLVDFDVVAVQKALQHKSATTTYTYLASGNKAFENALEQMAM